MGCTYSLYGVLRKKKLSIPEMVVFVPSMKIPAQCDLQTALKGLIPRDLIDRLSCLRNRIASVAEDTGGSAITELQQALEEYLSMLIRVTKKEHGLENLAEFKWKNLEDGRQETCVANAWFELLSVVHMMAMLTLSEADALMIPKDYSGSGFRVVSTDCKRNAVDLLLKAAGYLEFCVRNVIGRIPAEIKFAGWCTISIQAVGQVFINEVSGKVGSFFTVDRLRMGTEIQLGLAVESQKASLSVKRRLACDQLIYYTQAYQCLSGCDLSHGYGKKHMWFIKWKFLEAKAAAYYYHGLVLDKGNEPTCHVTAVCCFLVAQKLLVESKKGCISFCLAAPVTRAPPLWGAMKYLHQKIPEVASRKSQMYGYLLEQEKALQSLPNLPDFQLSFRPDDYDLPEIDSAWDCEHWENQSREHLKDCKDVIATE